MSDEEEHRIRRRKTRWFAALGAASFVLLAVFYLWEMLLGNRPAPDSMLEWIGLAVFVVPFCLLLGLAGELALEAIVELLKIPFDRNSADEGSRSEGSQTPE